MEVMDSIILGCGPSGMQTAIYLLRKGLKVIIFGREETSALYNARIENFFGYENYCLGKDLLIQTKKKLINLGAKKLDKYIKNITMEKEIFILKDEDENEYFSKSIVICLGVNRKILNIENEQKYLGKGISYCTECDGFFFKNKTVCIAGDGASSINSAIYLSNIAKDIFFVFYDDEKNFRKIKNSEIVYSKNIKVIFDDKIKSAFGDENVLKEVEFDSGKNLKVDGLFIEMGSYNLNSLLFNLPINISGKSIKVNSKQETNVNGIYAAGDITGEPYQLSKALSDGTKVGINLANYIKKIQVSY